MNIGIYLGDFQPETGGTYSLLKTIKKEILEYNGKHNLFIFYKKNGDPQQKFIENNITYINLWSSEISPELPIEIKRDLYRKFNDKLFKDNNIRLMIFLVHYIRIECTIPFIFTVWDVAHRMIPYFPEISQNGQFNCREEVFQYMLPRATYVLTGNQIGKKEILANYAINAEKIKTIAFPITDFCFEKIDIPEQIDSIKEPFVFYPAQFWAHKNHIAIVKAISFLKNEKNIKINCYFVGSDQGNLENVNNCIKHYDLEEQIKILGFVDYETLMYLYKNALAMVYVSLLGPNNLPPLEATALGCPLIFSNIPGHIEQMEGNGLPVNSLEPNEIGEAIFKIYSDTEFRKNMIENGLKFSEKFKDYSYFKEVLKVVEEFEKLMMGLYIL